MKTALDALWAKADAFEGMKTPYWATWSQGYIQSVLGQNPGIKGATQPIDLTSEALTSRLTRELDMAETFYVSPDMNRLVTAAAESWESDEKVWMEDFPSQVGWMWVPGGLTKIDIRGQLTNTSAISWHVTGGKVVLTYWTDKIHDRPDIKAQAFWPDMPRLTPWHVLQQSLGEPVVKSVQMGTLLPPEVSEGIYWMEGADKDSMTAFLPQGWSADQMKVEARTDSVVTWLVSALRIMQTPIADVRRQGLPANVRQSLLKRPHRFKNKAVTVIEFRRRKGDNVLHSEREFSHRWLRRGHWRKQWYGSEQTEDRRQIRIWIHPTICGPSDKPVLLRQHVNALTR